MIVKTAEALTLLESYAQARVQEKDLRRQMQALACVKDQDDGEGRCYIVRVEADYCRPCRDRSQAWLLFKSVRKANKAALRRLEALALGLNAPDQADGPAEPMALLELMHEA